MWVNCPTQELKKRDFSGEAFKSGQKTLENAKKKQHDRYDHRKKVTQNQKIRPRFVKQKKPYSRKYSY